MAANKAPNKLQINLVAQSPIGMKAIEFNSTRLNSIHKVEELPSQIQHNYPAFLAPRTFFVSREHYEQGTHTNLYAVLRSAAPKLDFSDIDCVISYNLSDDYSSESLLGKFIIVISIKDGPNAILQSENSNFCHLTCSERHAQALILSALLSIMLFKCFPFTLISTQEEKVEFLARVSEKWLSVNNDAEDEFIAPLGVPLLESGGIVRFWLQSLHEMSYFENKNPKDFDAAKFIASTWPKQGGAISVDRLRSLLEQSISSLTSHRPPKYRRSSDEIALKSVISGRATVLASLQKPSPERMITLAGLMRLEKFHRHACCILDSRDTYSQAIKEFVDERCLEIYDSRRLIAVSHLLNHTC